MHHPNDPADLLTQRVAELEKQLAHQISCRQDSDRKLMAADDALNVVADELTEAREDSARLTYIIEQSNDGNGWLEDSVWDESPSIEGVDDAQIIIRAAIDAARWKP